RTGDLVVISYGDRAQAGRLGRFEQHVHGGRAVMRVVRVHVEVHVDVVTVREPLADPGIAVGRVPPRGDPAVDLLELVRYPAPCEVVVGRCYPAVQPLAQVVVGDQALELGG